MERMMIKSERYKILQNLNQDKHMTTYLVFDELDKVKKVLFEYVLDKDQDLDLAKEDKFHHENLPHLCESFVSDRIYCEVYEYIEGSSLKEYIDTVGPIDLEEALSIFLELLYALKFLHDLRPKAFIHGNIHHENVVIKEKKVYLTNYKKIQEGKNPYIAPEALLGQEKSISQDIYSLGMLLYYLKSGQLKKPFYYKQEEDSLDLIISGCMAILPHKRYEDVGILINEIKRLLEKLKSSHKKLAKTLAYTGDSAFLKDLAKEIERENLKKVIILDLDLLHPSFSIEDYPNLLYLQDFWNNPDLLIEKILGQLKKKPLLVFSSYLEIENYENIGFSHLETILDVCLDKADLVFIKCSNFIYDAITISSYLTCDELMFVTDYSLKDMSYYQGVSEYLHKNHNIDKRRITYLIFHKKLEEISEHGLKDQILGNYMGVFDKSKKGYQKQLEKYIALIGGKIDGHS